MAWEWELRATRQASVRYIDGGDSLLSWSAAEGAPTGAGADLGDGVGEFWADTDGSLSASPSSRRRTDRGTASNLTSHNAGESFCSPGRRRRVGSERS